MSSFFGINSGFNFFGTSNASSGSSLFSDYAMIRNGTYKKLMRAYYGKPGSTSSSSDRTSKTEESAEAKQAKMNLKTLKTAADELKTSASGLKNSKAFIGKMNEETGEVEYDMEAIKKDVDSFVKSYNSTIKAAGNADSSSVLKKALWMISDVKSNAGLLEDVGITIGEDNTLSVNAEKFKEADISTLKTLFTGYGSVADKVMTKASEISRLSGAAINNASRSSYSSRGDYASVNTSSYYDKFF